MDYRYGMRLRGFSIGCQPMGGLSHAEEDETGKYWNILHYKRKLTDKECRDYELDYIGEEDWQYDRDRRKVYMATERPFE